MFPPLHDLAEQQSRHLLRDRALGLGRKAAFRRRNELFKRQGEWFFVATSRDLSGVTIHRHEPLQRDARSKPHDCEELIRFGGEIVYLVGGVEHSDADYRAATRGAAFRRAPRNSNQEPRCVRARCCTAPRSRDTRARWLAPSLSEWRDRFRERQLLRLTPRGEAPAAANGTAAKPASEAVQCIT